MRYEPLTPMEEAATESPSADHTPRFGFDQTIRSRGYAIKSRPQKGEPAGTFLGMPLQLLIQRTQFRAVCNCGQTTIIVKADNFFAGWQHLCEQMCAHHRGEL